MSNDFDQACRGLVQLRKAPVVLWLLRCRPEDVGFVTWADTRRVAWPGEPDRTGDMVAWVQDLAAGGVPFLIVIEFQLDPDGRMPARLLVYKGGLLGEYRPTEHAGDEFGVLAVVVNLRGRGNASRDMRLTAAGDGLFTSLGVRDVNLSELDAATTVEAVARGEVPVPVLAWVPLMRGGQDGKIIPRWLEVAAAEANPEVRRALDVTRVFADAAGCDAVWKDALKEWNAMKSKVVEEWREEGRVEGRREGRQEGRQEGLAEGRQQTAVAVSRDKLLRLLSREAYPLPEDIRQRVAGADLATLDRWFDAAITSTLEEFRAQL